MDAKQWRDFLSGWSVAAHRLPPFEPRNIVGFDTSETVLVTDGTARPLLAYAEVDLDSDWNPERDVRWKLAGRDYYDVPFEVRYWHPLPSLPELPTKD